MSVRPKINMHTICYKLKMYIQSALQKEYGFLSHLLTFSVRISNQAYRSPNERMHCGALPRKAQKQVTESGGFGGHEWRLPVS